MDTQWIALASIPVNGQTYHYTDISMWQAAIKSNIPDCELVNLSSAYVNVNLQEDGVYLSGELKCEVNIPCNRCTADANVVIEQSFSSYESYPECFDIKKDQEEDIDENIIRCMENNRGIELNPMNLIWQEFCLSLPFKPLCSESCEGICVKCGINKNSESCNCVSENLDLRMAALQNLVINNKKTDIKE